MASSVQQVQVDGQFRDKVKASVGEALQEAQNFLANSDNNANAEQYQLVKVVGVMNNMQQRLLTLKKTHEWQGRFESAPSERIPGKASGKFVHKGAYSQGNLPVVVGSKGAVIYGIIDKMHPALGYLLAWDKPDSNQYNKVYVEAGNVYHLEKMEWSVIEKKLAESSDESEYWDTETGAAAAAIMKDMGNKQALIGAVFDRHLIGIPQPQP